MIVQEADIMATRSFYEDTAIDAPETAVDLNDFVESGSSGNMGSL